MCVSWRLIGCRYPSTLTFSSGESTSSARRLCLGIDITNFMPIRVTQSVPAVQY
jgi:hypothetical protein